MMACINAQAAVPRSNCQASQVSGAAMNNWAQYGETRATSLIDPALDLYNLDCLTQIIRSVNMGGLGAALGLLNMGFNPAELLQFLGQLVGDNLCQALLP